MGCDIHLHTEIKVKGKWLHYSHPCIRRDYDLFCFLAGVHRAGRDITPISEPRGLPVDATDTTRLDSDVWGDDGHSRSWINAYEIVQVAAFGAAKSGESWWESDTFGFLFGDMWSGFTKYPGQNTRMQRAGVEDIRFVFWFDN